MKLEFKTMPNGDVIVPRAEYDRLKLVELEYQEDVGTARLVAQAKKDIAGGALLVPMKILERLAKGENPIRVLREFRDLTQTELATAEAVGITQNYLSDLENGKRKGPLELHRKIAAHLRVPLDLLTTIAVSDEQADPKRFSKRKTVIADTKLKRRQR